MPTGDKIEGRLVCQGITRLFLGTLDGLIDQLPDALEGEARNYQELAKGKFVLGEGRVSNTYSACFGSESDHMAAGR